jgi:hypothetical protein
LHFSYSELVFIPQVLNLNPGEEPKLKYATNEDHFKWKMTSQYLGPNQKCILLKMKTTSNGRRP